MGFFRQENWIGLPFLPLGDLPNPGMEPGSPTSPALAGGFHTIELLGNLWTAGIYQIYQIYKCTKACYTSIIVRMSLNTYCSDENMSFLETGPLLSFFLSPHSSTLAWKIPWMEEPGGLQSMGSWRVGHDWATWLSLFTFMHWRRKWQPTPCSCLENPRDGGAWWAAVYGVTQSRTGLKWLSSSSNLTQSNHSGNTCWNNCLLIDVYFQAVPLYKILPVVLQKYSFDNVIFIVPKLLMIIQFIVPKTLMVVHNLLYRIMSTYPGRVYSTHNLYSQSHSWPLLFTYSPQAVLTVSWTRLYFHYSPVYSVNRPVLFNSLWPHGLWPPRLLCPWNSPGKNTWLGCHFLLQVFFPTQGSNPCLPHCRQRL